MIDGSQLKALREAAGLTQTQLSEAMEITAGKVFISKIENNRKKVGLNLAEKWAKACNFALKIEFLPLK